MRDLPLTDGEEIIQRGSACICVGLHYSSWRPVNLILTNKRLLFCQPSFRIISEVMLDKVTDIAVVQTRFILGLKRKSLHIQMDEKHRYVAVNNPYGWKDAIIKAKHAS